MDIYSPVSAIKGVGEKTAALFEKLNIKTIADLLLYYPRDYLKYPEITDIDEMNAPEADAMYAIHAMIRQSPTVRSTKRMAVTLLNIGLPGHMIQLIWYRMPYLKNTLTMGKHVIFYGKLTVKDKRFVLEQPAVFTPDQYALIEQSLQPVYSLTAGVNNNLLLRTIRKALDQEVLFEDFLPGRLRTGYGLCEFNYALKQIHFPDSMDTLIAARRRLVFNEFFLFLMAMQYQKKQQLREVNLYDFKQPEMIGKMMSRLPFELTGAQKRTLQEIVKDMTGPYMMERLIQGDVGSGKTIIAFLIMAWVSANGYQSAIMAPTEVLARQHYETFQKNCENFGLKIPLVLLTGSMTARQKRSAYEKLQVYSNAIVIGTHALITDRTQFRSLGLVITDEQHRFGVNQRRLFAEKGDMPHILVMSATPIPRTLAIILYGDMDISVIDQVPARRLPIKNCVVGSSYRAKAYEFIRKEAESGHQAYVICPFVEESENQNGENVTDYAEKLKNQLPETVTVGVLHGKMRPALKEKVMGQFASGEISVLVSTTVVEVGVNVPNATVMMIENADRFGLAQLHQLRGRVGRGSAQSYCIMVNTSNSRDARRRLETLNASNDGFYIASQDLKLRGPGDFFGIRQSGDLAFDLADIYQDAAELKNASEAVKQIFEEDPGLESPQYSRLKQEMENYMDNKMKRMNL